MHTRKAAKGFTLVELLVVIAIVAGTIAAALAVIAAKQFIKAGAANEPELVAA